MSVEPVGAQPRKLLVVANETLTGDELIDAIRARAGDTDVLVSVIAPVSAPSEGYVVYEDTRRAAAGGGSTGRLRSFARRGSRPSGTSSTTTRSRRCATRSRSTIPTS